MVLRHSLGRQTTRRCLTQQSQYLVAPLPASRRGLAAPSSGSFQYETGDASGIKIASRDLAGPTSTVALVAKAGTRYQPLPGLAEGLEKYAFRNTMRRSALRIQREAELFGASLFSYHTRESIVLGAKFFRNDLPYFVELLHEVASRTKYLDHEFKEQVMDLVHRDQVRQLANTHRLAQASAHSLAFHRGLGEPVLPTSSTPLHKYLSHDAIGAYSSLAYTKPTVALVANGVEHSELKKWTGEYFNDLRQHPAPGVPPFLGQEQSQYFGGEERIAHSNGNTVVLAFPGSSSLTGGFYKPEVAVLAALLGGQSTIKWSPGFSLLAKAAHKQQGAGIDVDTDSHIYSDAGLLTITIHSKHYPGSVRDVAADAVSILKGIADGSGLEEKDFKRAVATARFKELEHGQLPQAGLELTGAGMVQSGKPYQLDESAEKIGKVEMSGVKKAAQDMLQFKACVSSVGDLFHLPYGDELGLKV
ncbi:MAG: ubiquinol-cytochrome c reductase core subunit 1 [Chrysothrix sp. TS-e1954]|nr:MAG: ubiquinol-cytochrome c reductase core subunit 1 [Chrysothrix sp. TS-e1954]